MRPTIDDVKALQADLAISAHVCYLDEEGFVIAHTEYERRWLRDLERQCALHIWLADADEMPVEEPGYYLARLTPQFLSSTAPWNFAKLDV